MPQPQPPSDADPDMRLFAAATARNREAIWQVLCASLPAAGLVLEVASGTGEHAAAFAARLPRLQWQPSDPDPRLRASIAGHARSAGLDNLRDPMALDVTAPDWPLAAADALVCINLLHIAPWAAAEGLFAGARKLLLEDAPLFLYGPFRRDGRHTAPSNAAFDRSLRAENPAWGVRDLEAVSALAEARGFVLERLVEMPANNLSLVYRRPHRP